MAINNINGIIDLDNLEKLQNSDYVSKYYNTALANQGQRWTNEVLLEYLSFNIDELIKYRYDISVDNEDAENTYISINARKSYDGTDIIFDNYEFKLVGGRYSKPNSLYYDNETLLEDFDIIGEDTVSDVLFIKKLNIIKQLYYSVILDIKTDKEDNVVENIVSEYYNIKLYIPILQKFEYACDGINKSVIYGSNKHVYVYVAPQSKDIITADDIELKGKICIHPSDVKFIKTSAYHFSFEFGSNIPLVERQYVLPFIDNDNHWWINNVNTYVSAKAENASNLNIIIAYLYKSGNSVEFKVLSGLNKYVDLSNVLEEKTIYIKRHNGDIFNINCSIPDLNKVNNNIESNINLSIDKSIVEMLENSTIILMTRLSSIFNDEDIKKEYQNGLITTIWTYVPNASGQFGSYEYISIEKGYYNNSVVNLALNFADITNFTNLINYTVANIEQVSPDNYLHKHLIFDQILQNNKQETTNIYAYPILQNVKGSQYDLRYANNFNFVLRYVNNIVGKNGDNIDKGIYNSSIKYFKSNDNNVTNSLYHTIKDNQTNYYPEYVPNYNIPLFDLSEVFVKDFNVINRQNILSFANDGKIYYSYLGTSFNTSDKSTLHLGTGETNINIGNYSLISDDNRNKFIKHDTISIDFDNIKLLGLTTIEKDLTLNNNLYVNNINWSIKTVDKMTIYSTKIIPKSKFIYYKTSINNISVNKIYHPISIDNMESGLNTILTIIKNNPDVYSKENCKDYLYANIILENKVNNIDYYYKYNDLIYIPHLLYYIGLNDVVDLKDITSNSNQIIYNNNEEAIFIVSSNNLLTNSITISVANDTHISISIKNLKPIYIGNTLDINHIVQNGKHSLIINEYQSHKIKSIWRLPNKFTQI